MPTSKCSYCCDFASSPFILHQLTLTPQILYHPVFFCFVNQAKELSALVHYKGKHKSKYRCTVGMLKASLVPLCHYVFMSQCSSFSVSVSQSVLVRVREEDTFICLSLTITPLLSITKEYLKSLGNSECSPQMFLENSGSLDKLLIIIQNEDIAAHVHKVRGLSPTPLHVSRCLGSPVSNSHDSASADPGIDQT